MDPANLIQLMPLIIPVVAILMPVAIVFIALYFKHQRELRLFETLRYLADKGQPIPRELLDPPVRPGSGFRVSRLSAALSTVGAGIGLIIFFRAMGMHSLWGIGALVASVGAAQLLAVWLERKRPQPGGIEAPPRA